MARTQKEGWKARQIRKVTRGCANSFKSLFYYWRNRLNIMWRPPLHSYNDSIYKPRLPNDEPRILWENKDIYFNANVVQSLDAKLHIFNPAISLQEVFEKYSQHNVGEEFRH